MLPLIFANENYLLSFLMIILTYILIKVIY